MHDHNMTSIWDFQFLTSLSLSLNTNEHETFFQETMNDLWKLFVLGSKSVVDASWVVSVA